MPCVQINLTFFFYKVRQKGIVVYEIFCTCENLKIFFSRGGDDFNIIEIIVIYFFLKFFSKIGITG